MERTIEVVEFLADTFNSNFDNTISCAYQIHSIYLEFLSDQEGLSLTEYIDTLNAYLEAHQLCISQHMDVFVVENLYSTNMRKIPPMLLEEFIGLYDKAQIFINGRY